MSTPTRRFLLKRKLRRALARRKALARRTQLIREAKRRNFWVEKRFAHYMGNVGDDDDDDDDGDDHGLPPPPTDGEYDIYCRADVTVEGACMECVFDHHGEDGVCDRCNCECGTLTRSKVRVDSVPRLKYLNDDFGSKRCKDAVMEISTCPKCAEWCRVQWYNLTPQCAGDDTWDWIVAIVVDYKHVEKHRRLRRNRRMIKPWMIQCLFPAERENLDHYLKDTCRNELSVFDLSPFHVCELDENIGQYLMGVTHLNLSNSSLPELPVSLFEFGKFSILTLDDSEFIKLPDEIAFYPHLRALYCRRCLFIEKIPVGPWPGIGDSLWSNFDFTDTPILERHPRTVSKLREEYRPLLIKHAGKR